MIRTAGSIPLASLALGLVCLTASFSTAKNHHVATTGNNASATGTAASPWSTIAKALEAAQAGDSVILHDGVYRESVRVLLPDITLKSAENEWAVIQAGFGTADSAELCVIFDVDASHGTLQRLELVGGYYTVKLETRWDWGGADRNGVSDILIEDCKIHDSGRDCIKITPKCDRVTIRRCEIYNSGQLYPAATPFDSKNAEGIDVTSGNRVLVQDCYVHDTATTGIYFKGGATDCIVERTRVHRCGQAGVLLGFDTSPEFFDTTVNPDYYECIRGIVRNCIIEDTNYAGVGFYAARDSLAANNTIINTARVGHSPIYFGLTFQDWDPAAGRPASVNVRVANNLVAQLEAIDQPALFIRYSAELGGMSALDGMPEMSNNLYFTASAAPRFSDARPQSSIANADLKGWQAHISGDVDSFVADPLLVNDGHLTTASPAIDRGAALEGVVDDFDREVRTSAPDIGADEFGAVPSVGNGDGTSDNGGTGVGDTNGNANGNTNGSTISNVGDDANPTNGNTSDEEDRDAADSATDGGHDSGEASRSASGDTANPVTEFASNAALCPMTSMMLLSVSVIGLRLARRHQSVGVVRHASTVQQSGVLPN